MSPLKYRIVASLFKSCYAEPGVYSNASRDTWSAAFSLNDAVGLSIKHSIRHIAFRYMPISDMHRGI